MLSAFSSLSDGSRIGGIWKKEMKYNDHYILAKYIANQYQREMSCLQDGDMRHSVYGGAFAAGLFRRRASLGAVWRRFWFICGNVLPDINKFTYFQGYEKLTKQLGALGIRLSAGDKRKLLISGHTAEGSRCYVNKYTRRFRQKYRGILGNALPWHEWYRLGKLMHYIADRFTYPHTLRYKEGFFRHVDYEEQLHKQFSGLIRGLQDKGMKRIARKTVEQVSFNSLYDAYRKEPKRTGTDCMYIVAVCMKYMNYLMYDTGATLNPSAPS